MAIASLPHVRATSERVADDQDLREQFDRIAKAEWLCLYRAAMRAGIEPSDAEDVVQETLLRAYRRLTGMSLRQRVALPVHSWLNSVATKVALERLARVQRQRFRLELTQPSLSQIVLEFKQIEVHHATN